MCLYQEVGKCFFFQKNYNIFPLLLQAVINMEKQSHEISHWLQSGLYIHFFNLLSS